jgi:hypothetical protein
MQFHSVLSTLTLMATAIVAQVQVGTGCSPDGSYICCRYHELDHTCVCYKGVWAIAHNPANCPPGKDCLDLACLDKKT